MEKSKLNYKSKNYPDGYKHQVMTTIELKTYLDSIEKRNNEFLVSFPKPSHAAFHQVADAIC